MKMIKLAILALLAVLSFGSTPAFAGSSYSDSSISGGIAGSGDAYKGLAQFQGSFMGTAGSSSRTGTTTLATDGSTNGNVTGTGSILGIAESFGSGSQDKRSASANGNASTTATAAGAATVGASSTISVGAVTWTTH